VKLLRRVLLALALLLLAALGTAAILLWRTVPGLGGRVHLAGLSAPVRVGFDSHGIPHIAAASDEDALRALGWLHARDRLWQMELLRHAALGRMAELLGPAAVASDRFLRGLDLAHLAALVVPIIPPETRRLLDAYVAGINEAITSLPGGRPLELLLARHRSEAWTLEQTIAIARLQAWDLASGSGAELARARALLQVGAARLAELDALAEPVGATIIPRGSGTWSGRYGPGEGGRSRERTGIEPAVLRYLAGIELPDPPPLARSLLEGLSFSQASNSWVIGPQRTRSGKPLLANDPHLELRAPSLWYLAAITSPTLAVAGGTIPGLPGIIIGRNRQIAWGLTNIELDDVDYVVERLSPDTARVLTSEGWMPVEVARDSIVVKGRRAVPFTLRRTAHGPLVWPPQALAGQPDSGEIRALARRWTAQEPSDELSALLAVNRARDWPSFLAALESWRTPEQNWVYADTAGNIGYAAAGRVPVRRSGRGRLPVPGWTGEGTWERYLDFEELPRSFNPAEGFIATANNRIVGAEYPHPLEAEFAPRWRAERIRQMILSGSAFGVEDVRRMQLDTVDLLAVATRELAAQAADRVARPDLAARLRAWDGTMGSDRSEPALFYGWYNALRRLTFEDDFPRGLYAPNVAFQAMLRAGASPWFDDTRTSEREDLAALSDRAMREALEWADTRWGEVHSSVAEHPMGSVKLLQRLFRLTIGPGARAGSGSTVNVGGGGMRMPIVNTHAASIRHVSDLSDTSAALFVIPTGQSGAPLSRRYRDQTGMWWRGELIRVGTAEGGSAATLVMVP
jgi:penicillin amidase